MAIKIARLVQDLRQVFCMTGFCLFVELHQEGSAPATCAVGLFSFYIEKKIDIFFLAGSHYYSNRRLGLSKTRLCFFVFVFSGRGLKLKNLPSFNVFFLPDFLKYFLQFQLKLSEFVYENKFIVFSFKMCVKKYIYRK